MKKDRESLTCKRTRTPPAAQGLSTPIRMRARTSGDAKPGEVKPGHADDTRVLARRLLPSALHSAELMNESHAHTHAETNRSSTCHITIVLPPGSARSPPTSTPPPARCVTPGRTLVVGFSAAETDERATFNDESASPSRWPGTFSVYASGLRRLPACISVGVDRRTWLRRRGIVIARRLPIRLRRVLTADPSVTRDRHSRLTSGPPGEHGRSSFARSTRRAGRPSRFPRIQANAGNTSASMLVLRSIPCTCCYSSRRNGSRNERV